MADYIIPRFGSPSSRIHGWCLEAVQEGESWLKAQRPAQGWANALQVLSEVDGTTVADGLSSVGYNKTKRVARELVAGLSNFRHEGEFKPTWDNRLYDRAHTLTNLDKHWYQTTRAWQAHRAALQYGVGTGTAYLYEIWDKHFHSPYRGDIKLQAYSPQDVTFVQLPKDHNIQRAYAVIIREELPLNLARNIWAADSPAFAESLVPDRDSPGWLIKGLEKLQQFVAPALRVAGRLGGQNDQRSSFPIVDIFHMYVMDGTINETGMPVSMGTQGTNWAYRVPSVGDPLPTQTINPETGNPFTIPAAPEHCRLFPLRRYVVFSRTATAYDGSSPWWHGAVPLARVSFGDWAWESLGSSVIPELKTMQDGIVAIMRGIEDSAAARLDPPAIYDDQQVSSTWAQAFNPRRAGVRAAANLQMGDPIKYPVDPRQYDVPQWMTNWIEAQEGRMDYVSSVTDLVAIAKAKQIPGADTLEKLLEMSGPIVQDNIRRLEEPLQQLGEWRKAYYFQFYTRARMLSITGPDGVNMDVQYLPEQLIPIQANETLEARQTRARGYLEDYSYVVTESGINEIHRMTNKLLYIQLQKAGLPISWWTLAKICQIPNFGPPPEGTNTEMERWIAQQRIMADLAVDQQAEIARRSAEQGLVPGGSPDGAGGEGAPAPGGNGQPPPSGNGEGRPASFNAAPRMVSKDGGARSTITTSR
jgi:hypothetical protein